MKKPIFGISDHFDTKLAVQPQKRVKGLKFRIKKVERLVLVAKTKAQICCEIILQVVCTFGFANTKSRFSHDTAQMKNLS